MLTATCRFETPNGAKYMHQLCKHFAHKVTVEFDDTTARADLPPGPAHMRSDSSGLDVEVTAQDDAGLTRAKFIIEDHLMRFAFREDPKGLTWST
ncbi:DUF2218 domain-containing protein [Pseudooceanicola nitratireducens]|jgi:hypothetical protein|uniref:DUF2218 domain-containing protein n=1 Tax=Pseudooceanicola nitratireducens TaxID=517719 RepID=UPI001C96304D|nr:DUF2218 domain-containing protein [Pseudooceanicola nitratireducens]MBY6156446.1 DUF2218 domain-containing protein [Pseudooceanicola nitratireducens]MBY6166760.1 DUF2218 domain-containing protein [Pseudooceanicola nitratireducens]MEC7668200.1 DUF2218 domain-containing protein [Pseudomonadota bacterium]MEC7795230.1 DUF2218 domain-containing protein [Pseudomonadota bacterium]